MYYLYPDPSRIGAPSFIQLSNPLVFTVYIRPLQGKLPLGIVSLSQGSYPETPVSILVSSVLSAYTIENRISPL